MDGQNTDADIGGALGPAEQRPDLVAIVKGAFIATGPRALEIALLAMAQRVQALEMKAK